jgi:hypothetical protein
VELIRLHTNYQAQKLHVQNKVLTFDHEVKEDEMGRTCSTHSGDEKYKGK